MEMIKIGWIVILDRLIDFNGGLNEPGNCSFSSNVVVFFFFLI